jgi:exodeoxyribonuclease VII large subunit
MANGITSTTARPAKEQARYVSITELNEIFNITLEQAFPEVCFTGEISQVTSAGSGHLYLKIKDANSQVSAVAWRSYVQNLKFKPEQGMMVLCHGRPNIYPKSGSFQVVLSRLMQAGEGLLQKKFLELKLKLEKEGLFAPERKRTLPFLPKSIGVVTSKTGAVIHDIMIRISERMPSLKVYLVDVRVQGPGAAQEIADGIRLLNERSEVDVIIVARGGGSLEDLWAFNEEVVVRAIFASTIPVVSGVGHEVDITLSDLAADVRAPTPTAAAEIVVPRRDDLLKSISQLETRLLDYERWFAPLSQGIDELAARLNRRMVSTVEERRLQLQTAEARLQSIEPAKLLSLLRSKVALLEQRLYGAGQQQIGLRLQKLNRSANLLESALPVQRLYRLGDSVKHFEQRLVSGISQNLRRCQNDLEQLSGQLEVVSPNRVLKRGFSIVERRANGGQTEILTSARAAKEGENLNIRLFQGRIEATVTSKND